MEKRTHLYKSVWYWDEDKFLTCSETSDGVEKSGKVQVRRTTNHDFGTKTVIFLENVDQTQQKVFKQKYQRTVRPNLPNIVTLQDIKDVVTFLLVGQVPRNILVLLHSYKINNLFRALIVYFQLHLQIWDDLKYRREAYAKHRLKHPVSVVRETRCKSHLSDLRSLAAQEFALLITGEGFYKNYHHMNNPLNRSYITKDLKNYDYVIKFTARIVWIALGRSNYKEIEIELHRLLYWEKVPSGNIRSSLEMVLSKSDSNVLHGNEAFFKSHWDKMSPLVSEIFINSDKHGVFLSGSERAKTDVSHITGLKGLLTLPEEVLYRCNLTLGILGQPRENFEAMLHLKQAPEKTFEEQEMEKALAISEEEEKPMIKMYQLLDELESTVDLNKVTLNEDYQFQSIFDEIGVYKSMHRDDGKRACKLWVDMKGFLNV